jgi:tRNA(Ile)-lysidine synthetase-like protein
MPTRPPTPCSPPAGVIRRHVVSRPACGGQRFLQNVCCVEIEPTPPHASTLTAAVAQVPPGAWGVAVSGGADSVALLSLLRERSVREPALRLHVVHLDHQTREGASGEDAAFVRSLAERWNMPCHVARRDAIEPALEARGRLPNNLSARFRAVRFEWFRQVVERSSLAGVILAHHADDQAETVLLRLLRGSGYAGLAGMSRDTRVRGVRVLRPMLGVPRAVLREHLEQTGQPWREDVSNATPRYARNRVRRALETRPELTPGLVDLSRGCRALKRWVAGAAPVLPATFGVKQLARLPLILARHAAGQWLRAQGVLTEKLSPVVVDLLIEMANDAASAPRQTFPSRLTVRRRAGQVWAERDRSRG